MCETSPLGVILVQNGSKGDKLLFRYPYWSDPGSEEFPVGRRLNSYALPNKEEAGTTRTTVSNIDNGQVFGFPDKVLSNLFAVKTQLCGNKLELKVNDVRFVGHPTLLTPNHQQVAPKWPTSSIILFNIVFALRATVSHSVVNCYHDLSKRLGAALKHEERRWGYLSKEAKIMLAVHDEVTGHPEKTNSSPFQMILPKSELARELKAVYESLCASGVVHIFLNNWVEISFCLPQWVHSAHNKSLVIEPEALQRCFKSLRPYHGVLLLVDEKELLSSLAQDSSPTLVRLIRMINPLRSLQQLAADVNLPLHQVIVLVRHLVYWAKATIIYPLCEKNVYLLSPHASTQTHSCLVEQFAEQFTGMSLLAAMAEYSFPTSISQNPMNFRPQQNERVQMVAWMLQHRLLMQLHTYVYLVTPPDDKDYLNHTAINSRIKRTKSLMIDNLGSHRGKIYSDMDSVTSDEFSTSPVNNRGRGSLLSDELCTSKHFHDYLPDSLSPAEKDTIMKIHAATNADDLRLFGRLCPYFRGCHHLEEIMYIENVRRSHLLAILDKFRKVLITCQHEDTTVAMFYHYKE